MTTYTLILFAHVAGSFLLFAGLAVEWLGTSYLRMHLQRTHINSWIHVIRIVPWFCIPASGLVLLSGGYLASNLGWNQAWVVVSFITLLVIGLIAAIVSRPRVRAIEKLAKQGPNQVPAALERNLNDPFLLASIRLRVALLLGIFLLMMCKPDVWWSLGTVAGSVSLGLILTVSGWAEPRNLPRRNAQTNSLGRQSAIRDDRMGSDNVPVISGSVANNGQLSQSTMTES